MSVSHYVGEEERESQVLRASVVDAAITLGPEVTGWMFDNAISEEDGDEEEEEEEEEEKQVSTPDLISSPSSSDDSHSTTLSSQDGHGQTFSRPMISYPTKLTPLSTLEDGYHLNSPFVVVDQNHFPRFPNVPGYPYVPPIGTVQTTRPLGLSSASTLSSPLSQPPAMKKGTKGLKISPKKPSSRGLPSQSSASEYTSSRPPPAVPALPSSRIDLIPRAATPSNAAPPALDVATPRTPKKLKKIRFLTAWKDEGAALPLPAVQSWDFKDPDRPSFFSSQERGLSELPRASSALGHVAPLNVKKSKKAVSPGDQDGYMSEGTGKAKARAKEKEMRPPLKRSMTSRLMSKLSTSDLQPRQPERAPPMPPLPHPIHDKFASTRGVTHERKRLGAIKVQGAKNQLSAEGRKALPSEKGRSPYLNESGSWPNVTTGESSPSSSTSSFAIVPDLNEMSRRIQQSRHDGRLAASDNETKLAILARLITEPPAPPAIEIHNPPESAELGQDVDVPSSSFVVPSPSTERRPSSATARYHKDTLSPKAPSPPRPPPSAALRNRTFLHAPTDLHINSGVMTSSDAARSGSAPPTMMNHQIQMRARQSPFPTKSILPTQGSKLTRSTSQSRLTRNPVLANKPRFLTPKRYDNVQTLPLPSTRDDALFPDVPRSVRSSYSKDQEREEQADEYDDRSVYSQSSRASFMDVEKSVEARGKLMQGVGALTSNEEPRWF